MTEVRLYEEGKSDGENQRNRADYIYSENEIKKQ